MLNTKGFTLISFAHYLEDYHEKNFKLKE